MNDAQKLHKDDVLNLLDLERLADAISELDGLKGYLIDTERERIAFGKVGGAGAQAACRWGVLCMANRKRASAWQ